ncbi:hypothetical protein [Aliamphritea spongicola]|nr:hypothetical protein [Aliamphritea spongicola]
MMWRNLVNYLPLQGVDVVYDQNFLMKEYPEAKSQLTAWGVPDEYAFKLAKNCSMSQTSRYSLTS